MTDDWGPAEWEVAWQSSPAHLRESGRQGVAAADDGRPDGVGVSSGVLSADTAFPDQSPSTEPDRLPDPSTRPASKPRPIWHAISPPRADPQPAGELHTIGDRIRGMAADLAASTCEWLHLIEQFDRGGGWAGVGVASCAAWLSWTCSVSPATAREYVRVARSLPLLPQIDAAFAAGKLSYSKVRMLVTVAAEVGESILLQQADVQTVSQLERTIRAFRRGGGWHREKERRASWRWDDDGMLVVAARLPPDEGALLLAALERSRADAGRTSEAGADPSDGGSGSSGGSGPSSDSAPDDEMPGTASPVCAEDRRRAALTGVDPLAMARADMLVARADMLVALAEQALAAGPVDSSGDDRHLVVVHADLDQLVDEPDEDEPGATELQSTSEARVAVSGADEIYAAEARSGEVHERPEQSERPEGQRRLPGPRCHIENGPGLDRQVARRMACDAALIAVVHHVGAGEPLRLGRKTRTIAPAQRRALRIRDGGCRFPGCHRRTHLDAHHIRPWSLFGPTDLDNLVLLCRFHHMLMHEGGFTASVVGDQDGAVTFRDPHGTPVSVPALPGSDGARPTLVQAIDPVGLLPRWRGEPFHLVETVGVLARSAAVVSQRSGV